MRRRLTDLTIMVRGSERAWLRPRLMNISGVSRSIQEGTESPISALGGAFATWLGDRPESMAVFVRIGLPKSHSASPPLRHRFATLLCQVVPGRDSWHVLARLDSANCPNVAE